jgi:hypothetical protein
MHHKNLVPLPRVHPREGIMEAARIELETFLLELASRHYLSLFERLVLLNEATARALGHALRAERQPEGSGSGAPR